MNFNTEFNNKHKSVMLKEAINFLNVRDDLYYIDATFGRGGYSKEILKKANSNLISLDIDPSVTSFAKDLKDKYGKRFSFIKENFKNIKKILKDKKINTINGGIVLDLGVSSMQIDNPNRGFSFMKDGPLDMRMSDFGITAQDIIYSLSEKELSNTIWTYGEEKSSRAIARLIVKERSLYKIDSTFKLADIVKKAKKFNKKTKIHPATKTFQALRILVNNELKSLNDFLKDSKNLLAPGARIVIVTFHSLEDRIVKFFFNKISGELSNANRHLPNEIKKKIYKFKKINKKPIVPKQEEIKINIRSRSAKLRAVERIAG